jgi:hypothetical protein
MKKLLYIAALVAVSTSALAANPAGRKLADEANAASTSFKLTATSTVSYGIGTVWNRMTLPAGTYPCHPILFGSTPVSGVVRKQCKLTLANGGVDSGAPVFGSNAGTGTNPNTPAPSTPTATAWTSYFLANETQTYVLNGARLVSFGTSTARTDKYITDSDSKQCIYQILGDAAPGPGTKFCTSISSLPETKIAEVGANFTLDSQKTVVFGGVGFYNQLVLAAGTYSCTTAVFGDPSNGKNGGCYIPNNGSGTGSTTPVDPGTTNPGTGTAQTIVVPYDNPSAPSSPIPVETNLFAFRGIATVTTPTKVLYGDGNGPWIDRDYPAGDVDCRDGQFPDPEVGVQKACRYIEAGNNQKVSDEGGSFSLAEPTWVAFGAQGQYKKVYFPIGTYTCNTARFGTTGVGSSGRICLAIKNGKPRTLNTQGPLDASIMTNGVVDSAKYTTVANTFGTDAGIEYRFGPSSAYYGTTGNNGFSNYAARPIIGKLGDAGPNAGGRLPNCTGTAGPNNQNGCSFMSFGPIKADSLDYSSSDAQIAYLPDADPDDRFHKKPYYGIANYLMLTVDYGSEGVLPQVNWTTSEGFGQNGADNDFNMDRYVGAKGGRPAWAAQVTPDYKPIASVVCTGHGGWCTNTLTVWKNGDITGHGGNTNHNFLKYNFLQGDTTKVPTAISITNSGEFALVTVWDTATTTGKVAVIALAEGCQGCNPNDESTWYRNWNNWPKVFAGLPGKSNYIYAKLLGYVDLPSNMKAPTGIVSSTGVNPDDYEKSDPWGANLETDEYERRSYFGPAGASADQIQHGNYRSASIAKSGVATVWSKSEKTVAFIDLQPLFAYYRQQYFGQSQSGFVSMIANRGPAANQWPYTFANTPSQKPTIAKVVTMTSAPTAGQMPNFRDQADGVRSVVTTQDGKMHLFTLGTVYASPSATAPGNPNDISELMSIDVGRNVTDVVQPAGHGWFEKYDTSTYSGESYADGVKFQRYMILNSRGDRKIQWVKFNSAWTSAAVTKTLQDQKLIDPISIFDAPNHGTESYVLGIADYGGRGVHNFLYGEGINMHTHSFANDGVGCANDNGQNGGKGGCRLLNGLPFEYGGFRATPGRPFDMGGQNVN